MSDTLRETSIDGLLTAAFALTHRMHETDHTYAPQRLADLRAQRDMIVAEIKRRSLAEPNPCSTD